MHKFFHNQNVSLFIFILIVVFTQKYNLGVCVITKKDGATLYITRDIGGNHSFFLFFTLSHSHTPALTPALTHSLSLNVDIGII
jgi:hypothetical protein